MSKTPNNAEPKQLAKWLKSQKVHANGWLSKAIALGAFNGLLMIAQTALLAMLVNNMVFGLPQSAVLIVAIVIVVLARAALGYGARIYSSRGAFSVQRSLRTALLNKIIKLGPAYSKAQGSAKLGHTLHQGIDSLEDYFAGYLPVVAYCAIIPLAILVAVFPIDWKSGLILLLTAPMVPFFMILIGHKAQQLNQQHWQKLLRMSSHFLDIIQGLTQLKIFNASRQEIAAVKAISDDFGDQTMAILKVAFLSSLVLEFLASIAIALVAVVLGFRLLYGNVDYTLALWILLLAPEFYLPFRQLGTQYHAKMAGVAAAQEMVEIFNQPAIETTSSQFEAPFTLKLSNVNFAYPNRATTLSQVNLTLEDNGLYAVIGESGAGKSTLIDLMLGFIQTNSGAVTVNNQPIGLDNRDAWLSHCGWISQQGHIFYGSLAFNVCLSEQGDIRRINQALAQAGLTDFVLTLSDGLDTLIGESGAGLSGGQAQRLALARAFYAQPSVLVLDEPTSHLDLETEQVVSRAISDYAKEHLVIVISHRLSTVVNAKEIIVMSQGQVVECGCHRELLNRHGHYAQLINPSLTVEQSR